MKNGDQPTAPNPQTNELFRISKSKWIALVLARPVSAMIPYKIW
jgi:hypothetical protein